MLDVRVWPVILENSSFLNLFTRGNNRRRTCGSFGCFKHFVKAPKDDFRNKKLICFLHLKSAVLVYAVAGK